MYDVLKCKMHDVLERNMHYAFLQLYKLQHVCLRKNLSADVHALGHECPCTGTHVQSLLRLSCCSTGSSGWQLWFYFCSCSKLVLASREPLPSSIAIAPGCNTRL